MKRMFFTTAVTALMFHTIAGEPAVRGQGESEVPVEMCLGAAADFKPVYPTSTFPPTSRSVTAVFRVDDDAEFRTLTAVFIAADVGDVAPANTEIARTRLAVEPGKRGRFVYSQDNAMPPGRYRLDILADGEPWHSVPFRVEAHSPEPPAIAEPAELFPLEEGKRWTYSFTMAAGPGVTIRLPGIDPDEDGTLRATVTLTVRETDETGTRVELHRNGQMLFEDWFRLDEKGLASTQRRAEEETTVIDPPQVYWPLPLEPQSWTYTPRERTYEHSCQMWGPVPVATPDGQALGYVVLVEQPTPLGKISVERHFVPGLGMVHELITSAIGERLASRQTLALTGH